MSPYLRCLLRLHAWTRWETYTWEGSVYKNPVGVECTGYSVEVTELRQQRACEACGILQDRKAKDG